MKDIDLELQQIANTCDNVRADSIEGDQGAAVRQLSVAVERLSELVMRMSHSLRNRR
jgi:hypothetical protein